MVRQKSLTVIEYNSIVRDLRNVQRHIDILNDQYLALSDQLGILKQTFLVPRGKKLGS